MTGRREDVLRGTLDLLILRVVSDRGALHGWAISRLIRDLSDETFDVNQGSLYPALRKLEAEGALESTWGTADTGKRARFYTLTDAGRRRLGREEAQWQRIARGMRLVLEGGSGAGS